MRVSNDDNLFNVINPFSKTALKTIHLTVQQPSQVSIHSLQQRIEMKQILTPSKTKPFDLGYITKSHHEAEIVIQTSNQGPHFCLRFETLISNQMSLYRKKLKSGDCKNGTDLDSALQH